MVFKTGDKVMVSSKTTRWNYPFAVTILEISKEGFYHVTDITPGIADPAKHNIRLATKEEIEETENERLVNEMFIQDAMERGQKTGDILSKGQEEADSDY